MTKTSRYKGPVLDSFLVPDIDMIFGEGVGASLVLLPTYLDANEPKDNWQNKQHQDVFQAFHETNQNLFRPCESPNPPMRLIDKMLCRMEPFFPIQRLIALARSFMPVSQLHIDKFDLLMQNRHPSSR